MFSSSYFEPWQQYHTPIVRQLAFALASPNLIHAFPPEITSPKKIDLHTLADWQKFYWAYQTRLCQLDKHPDELHQFLAKIKSTRLGLRFEALLWFWLQDKANPDFELLGHSIQSHHAGKTLGEIDFLVKNKHNHCIEHWEVCLKYYLAEYDLSLSSWIGLNPEDTFEHKLNHLVHKQFQFKQALAHHIDTRKAIIKGQLFLPHCHTTLPDWLNQNRRLGLWQAKIPQRSSLVRLTRPEWLCPNQAHTNIPAVTWWTNGLYVDVKQQYFVMLRFNPTSIFR